MSDENPITAAGREFFELSFAYFRLHRDHVTALLADLALTPVEMHALRALPPHAAVPMAALSARIHVEPSNVTAVVDRLVRRGLLRRCPGTADRRVREVALTDAGRDTRDELQRRLQPPPVLARLDPEQQRRLRDLFRVMLDPR